MLSLPIIWYFSLRISKPLIRLRQDADAISHLHFEENELEHSAIEEVDELHKSMSKMKLTLKQFISMGNMLTSESNFFRQMQGLLSETTEIASMTGGIIFWPIKRWGHLPQPPFVGTVKISQYQGCHRCRLMKITSIFLILYWKGKPLRER